MLEKLSLSVPTGPSAFFRQLQSPDLAERSPFGGERMRARQPLDQADRRRK
jgi:hypothetical protein